jgi:hypothetical protein
VIFVVSQISHSRLFVELVSIQPMSLPSGLLFYLDYTYGTDVGGDSSLTTGDSTLASTYTKGQSIYNAPTGKGIRSGSLATGGQYDLVGTTYSKVHKSTGLGSSTTASVAGNSWHKELGRVAQLLQPVQFVLLLVLTANCFSSILKSQLLLKTVFQQAAAR